MGLEVVEAADAVEGVTHDQERPALSDRFERFRDRAVLQFVRLAEHCNEYRAWFGH
jgi:hypothetical protein